MGKILKAEFKYNMAGILISYSIVLIAFLVSLIGDMDDVYDLFSVTFVTFFISIGIMGGESDKEKRDRFLTSLPIPLKQYSIARLLFVIFYQLGMFSILVIFYLLKVTPENVSAFWDIMKMNSYTLIFISFFIIYGDLKFYNSKYYHYLYLIIMLLLAALLIMGIVHQVIPLTLLFRQNFPKTFLYAAIFKIIFLGMYYVCFIVYNGRKSYLR